MSKLIPDIDAEIMTYLNKISDICSFGLISKHYYTILRKNTLYNDWGEMIYSPFNFPPNRIHDMINIPKADIWFIKACAIGSKLIYYLPLHYRINVHISNDAAIAAACWNNQIGVLNFFSTKYGLNMKYIDRKYVIHAIENGWLDLVVLLLKHNIDLNLNKAFRISCSLGHIEIAQFLLNSYYIDIHDHNDYAFKHSIINNHTNITYWLIEISNQPKFKSFDLVQLSKPLAIDPKHKIKKWIAIYQKDIKKLEKKAKKKK